MELSRRGFLKAGGMFAISLALPLGALGRLIPYQADGVLSYADRFKCDCQLCQCLASDLSMRHEGYVAHTVYGVEHIRNPQAFGSILRGLSIDIESSQAKRWAFVIDDQCLPDRDWFRHFSDNICIELNKAWGKSRFLPLSMRTFEDPYYARFKIKDYQRAPIHA